MKYLIIALLCAVAQGAWAQTEVSTEEALNNAITDGANIKLTADIALTNCFIIGDGDSNTPTVTLDLNGHTLSRSLEKAVNNGYVIYVRTGSTLTVKDSSGNNSGTLTGGWGTTAGGIYNSGTLYFEGGTITGCQSKYAGGGINNAPNASLTISGGAGIGGGEGGDGGSVEIYGGTVTASGDGIAAGSDSGIDVDNGAGIGGGSSGNMNGSVYIYGGTVTATGGYSKDFDTYGGAGIGGGGSYGDKGGNGGPVKIYGGIVTATGGSGGAGIGGGYNDEINRGGSGGTVEIHGGTVKAIFDMRYKNDYGNSAYIGHGGYYSSNSYDMGTITLGSDMMVCTDGTNSATADRVSTCQSHTDVNSTLTITACDHSSITGYTSKDDYYHHFDCQYCEGGDEHHTKGDGDACVYCGHALPTHAYTLYEANAGGTGYATEGTAYYVTATREFTFPECSVVPNKMVFAGWLLSDTEPSGLIAESTEDLIQADSTITVAMEEDRTYYARFRETYFSGGDGSVSDPFRISDVEDWNHLADAVKDGVTFSGKYFLLTNDISVTTMVGKDKNRFQGRFDGDGKTITFNVTATEDYCAPFCRISGATIKNLNTTGTITTDYRYAAGVVAYSRYYSRIENCRSDVTIRSSHAGWAGHGGILGLKADVSYSKPTIEGCVFEGKILSTGATATTGGGGIVGLTNGQTLTIKNCLYKPAALEEGETPVAVSTIYANSSTYPSTVTCTDCYYTEAYGSAESGTRGYTVTSGTDGLTLDYGEATTTYAYGGVKVYSFGLSYGTTFNGQRSMVNGQRSTFNGQRSMVNVQWSMVNVQRSMVNVQRSMFNVQRSTFSTPAARRRSPSPPQQTTARGFQPSRLTAARSLTTATAATN